MSTTLPNIDPMSLDADASLETVLAAWHVATIQLEQTHITLCEEVQRLTNELEQKNRELARKSRLADLGRMASHIAHEVRNNMMPVTLYMSLLRRKVGTDPEIVDILNKIQAGFTDLDVTVHDLLHFTADRDPQRQTISVGELVEEVVVSLAPQLSAQAIEPTIKIPLDLAVSADRDMLRRAILNLTLNAVDAMPDGGTLTLQASLCDSDDSDLASVNIEVVDTGPGLETDDSQQIFEPFYTTKSSGTGLGLAIVARIIEVHGGNVSVRNNDPHGAVFTLQIPK